MYHQKTWQAGVSVAVHKSASPRMGRVCAKKNACGKTRAAVKAYNDRLSERKLTMLVNENFLPGDGNVVLRYAPGQKPSPEQAARYWKKCAEAMRAMAAAGGVEFKFIHAIALGERGAMHHHLIVNRECIPFLAACWKRGSVHVEFLYDKRNYQKLAKYFCGQEKGENEEDPKAIYIHGNKYSASRNLRRPEAETEVVEDAEMEKYPEPEAGYLIDVDSIELGKNPVNGKPYQFYIMLPLAAPPASLRKVQREAWLEREQVKNRAEVRWKVDRLLLRQEEKERQYAAEAWEDE